MIEDRVGYMIELQQILEGPSRLALLKLNVAGLDWWDINEFIDFRFI